MLASYLFAASAAILLFLGTLHLVLTFASDRLHPRDAALRDRMHAVTMRITPETTMWRAWVGFNISHSFCAMLFGAVYGYLALARYDVLVGAPFLVAVGGVMLLTLVWVAKRYWFSKPLIGIVLSTACYFAAVGFAYF